MGLASVSVQSLHRETRRAPCSEKKRMTKCQPPIRGLGETLRCSESFFGSMVPT